LRSDFITNLDFYSTVSIVVVANQVHEEQMALLLLFLNDFADLLVGQNREYAYAWLVSA
jgi:hypothetical protein